MNRFFKLTALLAVIASFSVLASKSFARDNDVVGAYNPYSAPNGASVGMGIEFPGVTFNSGADFGGSGNGTVHGGGNVNKPKPHPIKVLGLQRVASPTATAKSRRQSLVGKKK